MTKSSPAQPRAATVTKTPRKQGAAGIWLGAAGLLVGGAILYFALNNPGMAKSTTISQSTPIKDPPVPPAPVVTVPAPAVHKYSPTFISIPKGVKGNPLGYWEYLPSTYYADSSTEFPMVIFFHGIEQGGNGGAADLDKVLKFGPPNILKDTNHPLHNLFEQRGVIVLSPQGPPPPDWWHAVHMAPFLTYAFGHYRIDHRRIYLTGIFAGSLGINELMDRESKLASQSAAILLAADQGVPGGVTQPFEGASVGAKVPY